MVIPILISVMFILIIVFFLGFIEEGVPRRVLTGVISLIYIMGFGLYLDTNIDKTPKYQINDKVLLPNNTWGNVDSVAYKIEGVWYNQKLLKD
jgi:hypothetical protein